MKLPLLAVHITQYQPWKKTCVGLLKFSRNIYHSVINICEMMCNYIRKPIKMKFQIILVLQPLIEWVKRREIRSPKSILRENRGVRLHRRPDSQFNWHWGDSQMKSRCRSFRYLDWLIGIPSYTGLRLTSACYVRFTHHICARNVFMIRKLIHPA